MLASPPGQNDMDDAVAAPSESGKATGGSDLAFARADQVCIGRSADVRKDLSVFFAYGLNENASAGSVLSRCVRQISFVLNKGGGLTAYKIGITSDPHHRWSNPASIDGCGSDVGSGLDFHFH